MIFLLTKTCNSVGNQGWHMIARGPLYPHVNFESDWYSKSRKKEALPVGQKKTKKAVDNCQDHFTEKNAGRPSNFREKNCAKKGLPNSPVSGKSSRISTNGIFSDAGKKELLFSGEHSIPEILTFT